MRPLWITQDMGIPDEVVFTDFHPIICCTASKRIYGGEGADGGYIQGAGDDSEGWACVWTPLEHSI
jgi:tRNA A64-2'-O-ribosylphosphate transferase